MKTYKLSTLLLIVMAAVGLSSCNSNDGPGAGAEYFADFVTFRSVNAQGSVFTYREDGDSELITLTSPTALDLDEFKLGSRLVITYTTQSNTHGISEPITLIGASNVIGGGEPPVSKAPDQTDNYASNTITYQGIARTGDYLNIVFSAPFNGQDDSKTTLYLDPATLDSEYPELHLVFGPFSFYATQQYMFYVSYSIESIWERPDVKGIKVYANTDNAEHKCVTFNKPNQTIKPAE